MTDFPATRIDLPSWYLAPVGLWSLALGYPAAKVLASDPALILAHRITGSDLALLAAAFLAVAPLPLCLVCGRFRRRRPALAVLGLLAAGAAWWPLHAVVGSSLPDPKMAIPAAAVLGLLAGAAGAASFRRFAAMRVVVLLGAVIAPAGLVLRLATDPRIPRLHDLGLETPIVLVTVEDWPLSALLNDGGRIDPHRFPRLADLAEDAIWFRGARTPSDVTAEALEAIVTGHLPRQGPGRADRNLCAALADYRIYWTIPVDLCRLGSDPEAGWSTLIGELIRGRRPGGPGNGETGSGSRPAPGTGVPGDSIERLLAAIDREPRALYGWHSSLATTPWDHFRSGERYRIQGFHEPGLSGGRWGGSARLAEQGRRRHLEELSFLDRQVGRLLDRLDEVGLYERAAVVFAATRGVSFRPDERLSSLSERNHDDILRVPFLLKPPIAGRIEGRHGGARTGGVRKGGGTNDRLVSLVDVLPTLFDLLGRTLPWPADGVSVLDPGRQITAMGLHRAPFTVSDLQLEPGDGRLSDPQIGRTPDSFPAPPRTSPAVDFLSESGLVSSPGLVAGRLAGACSPPTELALAVDRRIVATSGAYGPPGGDCWFSFFLTPEDLAGLEPVLPGDEGSAEESRRGRVYLVEPAEGGGEDFALVELPPAARSRRELAVNAIDGFLERVETAEDAILIRGWAAERATGLRPSQLEVFSEGRHIYSRRLPPSQPMDRFLFTLPRSLIADLEQGLRLAAVTVDGKRQWIGAFYRPLVRGGDPSGTLERSDGWRTGLQPGEIVGAVEQVRVDGVDLRISGWAVDTRERRPFDQIHVFRDIEEMAAFVERVDRPDIGIWFRSRDFVESGFEIRLKNAALEESTARELPLRVVALGRIKRTASLLPVLRTVGPERRMQPRIDAPRLEDEGLQIDEERFFPFRAGAVLGWVEEATLAEPGISLPGWALDRATKAPADAILAFLDGDVVAFAAPDELRADVAETYGGSSQGRYGFTLSVSAGVEALARLRVIALTRRGWVVELPWLEWQTGEGGISR